MRDSCMIYRNQAEAIKELPPEQFKAAVVALWEYELDGITPNGDPSAIAMWKMAQPLIDKRRKAYENGLRGGRPKAQPAENQEETETEPNDSQTEPTDNQTEPTDNQTVTDEEPNDSQNEPTDILKDKGERIYIKEIPSKEGTKKSGFTPPTLQEVQGYISEKGYKVDAERFVDFYASKGWYVGKNKMKDWKAAVRNWNRSQRQETTTKGRQEKTVNRFNDFKQRDYDYADLEKRLLGRGV